MRRLVIALAALGALVAGFVPPAATEVLASRASSRAVEIATPPADLVDRPPTEEGSTRLSRELAIGALVVGGTFVLGLVAGGSVVTAIASAGAVVIIYSLMP